MWFDRLELNTAADLERQQSQELWSAERPSLNRRHRVTAAGNCCSHSSWAAELQLKVYRFLTGILTAHTKLQLKISRFQRNGSGTVFIPDTAAAGRSMTTGL